MVHQELVVRADLLVLLEQTDHQELVVQTDLRELQEQMVPQVLLALQVLLDHPVSHSFGWELGQNLQESVTSLMVLMTLSLITI
jgi:hypothetical protein